MEAKYFSSSCGGKVRGQFSSMIRRVFTILVEEINSFAQTLLNVQTGSVVSLSIKNGKLSTINKRPGEEVFGEGGP